MFHIHLPVIFLVLYVTTTSVSCAQEQDTTCEKAFINGLYEMCVNAKQTKNVYERTGGLWDDWGNGNLKADAYFNRHRVQRSVQERDISAADAQKRHLVRFWRGLGMERFFRDAENSLDNQGPVYTAELEIALTSCLIDSIDNLGDFKSMPSSQLTSQNDETALSEIYERPYSAISVMAFYCCTKGC